MCREWLGLEVRHRHVSDDFFCDIFVRGFRSDSGGRFSMILGRSVGRSVSQALGRSVRRSRSFRRAGKN